MHDWVKNPETQTKNSFSQSQTRFATESSTLPIIIDHTMCPFHKSWEMIRKCSHLESIWPHFCSRNNSMWGENTFGDDTERVRGGRKESNFKCCGCSQILALMKFRLFRESAAARCRHTLSAGRLPSLQRRLYSAGGFPQFRFASKIKMGFLLPLGYKRNYIY